MMNEICDHLKKQETPTIEDRKCALLALEDEQCRIYTHICIIVSCGSGGWVDHGGGGDRISLQEIPFQKKVLQIFPCCSGVIEILPETKGDISLMCLINTTRNRF